MDLGLIIKHFGNLAASINLLSLLIIFKHRVFLLIASGRTVTFVTAFVASSPSASSFASSSRSDFEPEDPAEPLAEVWENPHHYRHQ